MPHVFDILLLELPHGSKTFCMTFEPKFPGPLTIEIKPPVVEAPIARPQNIPATIQQETVLQQVPIGSGLNAIVTTYPVPKKIRVIDPYDLSATESESKPSTPQLFLKLLESISKVQELQFYTAKSTIDFYQWLAPRLLWCSSQTQAWRTSLPGLEGWDLHQRSSMSDRRNTNQSVPGRLIGRTIVNRQVQYHLRWKRVLPWHFELINPLNNPDLGKTLELKIGPVIIGNQGPVDIDSVLQDRARLEAERIQAQERDAVAERAREHARAQERDAAAERVRERARERARETAREEAAKTITQIVLGSIVTYSAGLNIPSLIAGFETCTLHVKNLPLGVSEGEVRSLFVLHGMDIERFHVVGIKKVSDEKLEARIISDAEAGRALASRLDGFEFRDDTLSVDVSASNTLEGMSAAVTRDTDVLTISWRSPSVRYVAEFIDIATAQEKVPELNNKIFAGRRVKVEMNTQPPGRFLPNFETDAIKISNLPLSVTEEEVMAFTGTFSVRRLPVGRFRGVSWDAEQVADLIRDDIERAVPIGLRQFDPPGAPDMNGVLFVRAHFSSWDEAHVACTSLEGKRYGNPQPVWLRLPDPMHFTIIIPSEQYTAQKAQWGALLSSITDRKACMLNVHDVGNIVRIRLAGSAKEAMGAMKVRVENLARGEMIEGWHRSLGFSNNPFFRRVFVEAGAYVRADWRRQSLKVYGAARAVNQARDLIKTELERLASLDYTVTLMRHSVGFFVREGIPQLKETLGENNVRFAASSRKITVTGGEEARHALDVLITLSLKGDRTVLNSSQGEQTCPICYDSVSSPQQLGCGHVYCVACLRHFLSSALDSVQLPLTCLGDDTGCRVPIPIPTIQQFLPPASFNRLLEVAFDSHVSKHPEEFKCCKTPDCTQLYRSVRPGDPAKALQCPSCFASVCNACNEDAHEGLTCAESRIRKDPAEQDRLNDEWIASQDGRVKKCPRCSVLIEKTEGCNHMTCRCGAHICWRCMGTFTAETIYPHMHSAHGTIHDDIPPVPQANHLNDPIFRAVDIEQQRELLRQAELRRVAAIRDQNLVNAARQLREMQEEEARVRERARLRQVEQERNRLEQARLLHEGPARLRREEIMRDYETRQRLAQARQLEEQERQRREQARRTEEWQERQRREERRRQEQQQRQDGGWGCTIM
ncbi:hypothetical protein PAXRUDRAFT_12315 [Paxillus rubicundulus Ve08.2h10]|uniref:RBR-type E3 ubiquitin transferase n=1 Tax=Paxillus rubicundulus Ve08.2h10 TaxID=930991 RepID=A0A0D0E7I1_9AGAM|nr:hypothetical protein PAXRUDRAFT_12315 [Paxillus rubicundulus Ve08.2h10]